MKVELEVDVVQATVNYLQKQPFQDVHNLIQELLQAKKVVDPDKAKKKE